VDDNIVQLLNHREDPETIIIRKAQEHNFLIYLARISRRCGRWLN
jgi:hypothetical protein